MAVHVKFTDDRDEVEYSDRGTGEAVYRYHVHASGALQIIETPAGSIGLGGSNVVAVYGPTVWFSVSGLLWAGTVGDLA